MVSNHNKGDLTVTENPSIDRVLRIQEVAHITGYSRPSIYRLQKLEQFPHGFRLGPGATGWRLSSIMAWIDEKEQGGRHEEA